VAHHGVTAGQQVTIQCDSSGGNPAPSLTLKLEGSIISLPSVGSTNRIITMTPSHNTQVLACSAINKVMEQPRVTEMVMEVRFGPESVVIGGPSLLKRGQSHGFECISSASNPPSEMSWSVRTREGVEMLSALEVSQTSSYWTGSGWETSSTALLHPGLGLTSLVLTCSATNPHLDITVEQSKQLSLQFGPDWVSVRGPEKSRSGDLINLYCESSPSVPAASLQWTVGGFWVTEGAGQTQQEEVEQLSDGSFITRSHMDIKAGDGIDMEVVCYGTNPALRNDSQAALHIIEIIRPPGVPTISGVISDSNIQHLTCSTNAGHPPARLSWYRGSEMMDSHYTLEDDTVSAIITFVPSQSHQEELTCEASNDALSEPVRNTITIEAAQTTTTTTSTTTAAITSVTSTTITTTATISSTTPWMNLIELTSENLTPSSTPTETEELIYDEEDLEDYNFSDLNETSSEGADNTENNPRHEFINTKEERNVNVLDAIEDKVEGTIEPEEVKLTSEEEMKEKNKDGSGRSESVPEDDAVGSQGDISETQTQLDNDIIKSSPGASGPVSVAKPRSQPRYSSSNTSLRYPSFWILIIIVMSLANTLWQG